MVAARGHRSGPWCHGTWHRHRHWRERLWQQDEAAVKVDLVLGERAPDHHLVAPDLVDRAALAHLAHDRRLTPARVAKEPLADAGRERLPDDRSILEAREH